MHNIGTSHLLDNSRTSTPRIARVRLARQRAETRRQISALAWAIRIVAPAQRPDGNPARRAHDPDERATRDQTETGQMSPRRAQEGGRQNQPADPVRLSSGQHYGKWPGKGRGEDDEAGQTCYLLPYHFQQVGILVRSARRKTDNDRLDPIR